ncbi:MAG: IS110 family transposase [Anaeromyxobacteraceae bacterium]
MESVRFVGLDVHADSIAIAVAEPGRGEPSALAVVANDTAALLKRLRRLGTIKCCYEAGPTGFGLYRALNAGGVECVVVAPSLVPMKAGDRVKTDRRDAVKLARFLRSGDLTEVHVPDEATEAMRDLERARDAAKKAERVARHQLGKFLLRHGRRWTGKTRWTRDHLAWVRVQHFEHEAQQRVLEDYLKTVEDVGERVRRHTRSIEELVESWSRMPLVKALQSLRGVNLITATVLAAELGDLDRFATAPELMGYLGLVPSEHSSGETRQQGRITRAGNGHARRILVEAAWAYRYRAANSPALRKRSRGLSEEVLRIAWRAQERLCGRYRKLTGRGMNKNRVVVAIARELAGFVWAIGRQPQLLKA